MTALLLLALSQPPQPAAPVPPELAAWVADLGSDDHVKQRAATDALVKAGPKAKACAPALVKLLASDRTRLEATRVLVAIGPDAKDTVPALVARLESKDAYERDLVAIVLGAIGPSAKGAVSALVALLPKEEGWGPQVETIAVAVLRIDGPRPEITRALLLSRGKCQPIYLQGSLTLHERPVEVVAHVVALCADKDKAVRVKAATVLGDLKSGGRNSTTFDAAGASVKGIPAALEKLLSDEAAEVRLAAASAISRVAPELAPKMVPVVVAVALDDKHADLFNSYHAATIFASVPKDAAKALIPLFDHTSERVRWWAVSTMANLHARDPLETALKDAPSANGRAGAATALGARYSDGHESLPALTAALKDREFQVRFAAARAVIHISTRDYVRRSATVPVFIEGCRDKSAPVRTEAAQYLNSVGAAAKAAVPVLNDLLKDEKSGVREAAAHALVAIDPASASGAVPVLIEVLKTGASDHDDQARAAEALAVLGPVAKDAVPELVKLFDSKSPFVRVAVADAASRLDPAQNPKAVGVLVTLLKDAKYKRNVARSHALKALARVGADAKPALPILTELLADDGRYHEEMALTMVALDPSGAKPAIEWIRKELKDADPDERLLAGLPALGAGIKALTPELTSLLKSRDADVRQHAARALGAIGPDAKAALPDLKKLAENDPEPQNRTEAAEAVKRIESK